MQLVNSFKEATHACLGGCGTRAFFYYGFFGFLRTVPSFREFEKGLRGVAGTSSGSMVALALCVGADFGKLCKATQELGIENVAPLTSVHSLFDRLGLDDGATLRNIIASHMAAMGLSPAITFEMLWRITGKELVVCATNVETHEATYFSHRTSPNLSVAEALYMSMTVPIVFEPMRYKGSLYADGGLSANVPVHAFGSDAVPLVVHVRSSNVRRSCATVEGYAKSVLSCTLSVQMARLREMALPHAYELDDGDETDTISLFADASYIRDRCRHGAAAACIRAVPGVAAALQSLVFLSLPGVM